MVASARGSGAARASGRRRRGASLLALSAGLTLALAPIHPVHGAPAPAGSSGWPAPATAGGPSAPATAPAPAPATTSPRPVEGPAPPPAPRSDDDDDDDDDDDKPRDPKWMRSTGIASLAGGLSLFAIFYAACGITGAAMHDAGVRRLDDFDPARVERGHQLIAIGKRMVIPVAGPFLAIPHMSTDEGIVFSAFGGALQIIGLAMAAFGATQLGIYRSMRGSQSGPPMASRRRLRVMGAATPSYAGGGLSLRF